MARSVRKQPISGITTAESEKQFKRQGNRRYRRCLHLVDWTAFEDGAFVIPSLWSKYDPWKGPKDGKQYWKQGCTDYRWMGK